MLNIDKCHQSCGFHGSRVMSKVI